MEEKNYQTGQDIPTDTNQTDDEMKSNSPQNTATLEEANSLYTSSTSEMPA